MVKFYSRVFFFLAFQKQTISILKCILYLYCSNDCLFWQMKHFRSQMYKKEHCLEWTYHLFDLTLVLKEWEYKNKWYITMYRIIFRFEEIFTYFSDCIRLCNFNERPICDSRFIKCSQFKNVSKFRIVDS